MYSLRSWTRIPLLDSSDGDPSYNLSRAIGPNIFLLYVLLLGKLFHTSLSTNKTAILSFFKNVLPRLILPEYFAFKCWILVCCSLNINPLSYPLSFMFTPLRAHYQDMKVRRKDFGWEVKENHQERPTSPLFGPVTQPALINFNKY